MTCCGKKVKQVATKATHITKGWLGLMVGKATPESRRRLQVCRNCSSNRWNGLRMWCKECKCYLPAKVRVPEEKCKLNKW